MIYTMQKINEGLCVYEAMVNNYNTYRKGGVGDKKSHVNMINDAIMLCKNFDNPFKRIKELEEQLRKAQTTQRNAAKKPTEGAVVTGVFEPEGEKE